MINFSFLRLFKTVVSIIANEFFDSASFDVIDHACSEIDSKWPITPPVGSSGMELHLLNRIIHVKIPRKCDGSLGKIPRICDGSLGKIGSNSFLSSPTTPAKDTVSKCGIHPSNSSPSLSSASQFSSRKFSMKDLEEKLERSEDTFPDVIPKEKGVLERPLSPPVQTFLQRPLSPRIEIFLQSPHEINYFQCFFPLLNDIQLLWELVITCEPIIVMAPTPDVTCEVVQALVSTIYPLKYVPDFRPFFTIHDSEFKEYTTTTGQAP